MQQDQHSQISLFLVLHPAAVQNCSAHHQCFGTFFKYVCRRQQVNLIDYYFVFAVAVSTRETFLTATTYSGG